MVNFNEVTMLILGGGVFVFILRNIQRFKHLPLFEFLIAAYSFLLAGWISTFLESFFLPDLLNLIEHCCYLISSLFMLYWCCSAFKNEKGAE
jgi:hypothetical protein